MISCSVEVNTSYKSKCQIKQKYTRVNRFEVRTFIDAVIIAVLLMNHALYKLLSSIDTCSTASNLITQRLHITHTHTHRLFLAELLVQ